MQEMTGLSQAQLEWTYTRCRPALAAYRQSMRLVDDNQPLMSLHDMLCIALHWLRKGHPWREMEAAFSRPHQWLHTMVRRVVAIIGDSIFGELIRPIDSTSPPPSLLSIDFSAHTLLDTPTPIAWPRPTRSAWRVQLAGDPSHRIIEVSKAERGAAAPARTTGKEERGARSCRGWRRRALSAIDSTQRGQPLSRSDFR